MTARASNTIHAKNIIASVELASDEAIGIDRSDWPLAIIAVAFNVALIAREGHHVELVAILACVFLILDPLKFESLSSDEEALAKGGEIMEGGVSIRIGGCGCKRRPINLLRALVDRSVATKVRQFLSFPHLFFISLKDALCKKHHPVTIAQMTSRGLSILIVVIELVDIQVADLALFEFTTAFID